MRRHAPAYKQPVMQVYLKNKFYVKLMSFFLFNDKMLDQNRNKNAIIINHIIQIYLSIDVCCDRLRLRWKNISLRHSNVLL